MITLDIINALREDFSKITTANGYNTNLVKSYLKFRSIEDVREFDSFYIQGLASQPIHRDSYIEWKWGIAVYFYLDIDKSTEDSDLMDERIAGLKEDINTLINTEMNVQALDEVEAVTLLYEEPYMDDGNNKVTFLLLLEITYND